MSQAVIDSNKQLLERAKALGLRERDYASGMGRSYQVDYARMRNDVTKAEIGNVASTAAAAAEQARAEAAAARAYSDSQIAALRAQYEQQLSQDRTFTSIADQIRGLTSGVRTPQNLAAFQSALGTLSGQRNFGSSDLSNKLNFQISDQQILDDLNTSRFQRLGRVVEDGNTQITGIGERLNTANSLLAQLPSGDPRRASSAAYIKELQADLKSVQDAVANAQGQITNFKPLTLLDADGLKEITAFREFVRLPEERASDQLRQIDPEAYQTAIGLGQRYREMATEPLPDTTDPRTEELRGAIEDEALNQLRLGSTLDQEVRRNVEQGVRAAQTARGNIFGVGPAVEEAMQTGLAGEQRKLARYGAAAQFLGSGQTRGDALAANLAFRDALLSNRLGAAGNFVAAGPSLYNLANTRTGQQQSAFANYINANQANPGQFNPAIFQTPGYVFANPDAPVQMAGQQGSIFSNLYGQQANYASDVYRSQTGAIASTYTSPSQAFGNVMSGLGSLGNIFNFGTIPIGCWVAREVYGEENPKWMQFRSWLIGKAPRWLVDAYCKFGPAVAKFISNKPWIKAIIRKWMDGRIKSYGYV